MDGVGEIPNTHNSHEIVMIQYHGIKWKLSETNLIFSSLLILEHLNMSSHANMLQNCNIEVLMALSLNSLIL